MNDPAAISSLPVHKKEISQNIPAKNADDNLPSRLSARPDGSTARAESEKIINDKSDASPSPANGICRKKAADNRMTANPATAQRISPERIMPVIIAAAAKRSANSALSSPVGRERFSDPTADNGESVIDNVRSVIADNEIVISVDPVSRRILDTISDTTEKLLTRNRDEAIGNELTIIIPTAHIAAAIHGEDAVVKLVAHEAPMADPTKKGRAGECERITRKRVSEAPPVSVQRIIVIMLSVL